MKKITLGNALAFLECITWDSRLSAEKTIELKKRISDTVLHKIPLDIDDDLFAILKDRYTK